MNIITKICATVVSALLLTFTSAAVAQINLSSSNPLCVVHEPWGKAAHVYNVTTVCRTGYVTHWDSENRIPLYVTYTLTPQQANGCAPRSNMFKTDSAVPRSSRPEDYTGTGYDKGHAAPSADQAWSIKTEVESYYMSNMYPQAGSLNRGIWKLLETAVRGWTIQGNATHTIIVGGVVRPSDIKIGTGVTVPHMYYKIVVNHTTGQLAGWTFRHLPPYPNLGNDLLKYRTPVADIMTYSGITFNFPSNGAELPLNRAWSVDYAQLADGKRAACKK